MAGSAEKTLQANCHENGLLFVLHGSAGGRSEPILACVQAMRTDFGRPKQPACEWAMI